MTQRVFDRVAQPDPRDMAYPIRPLLAIRGPRSYTWGCARWLDQGSEGACVGHAWAHELAARPKVHLEVDSATAFLIYREAQKIDEWEGEAYSGTSVRAGAKICQQRGWIKEYRWAYGVSDALDAISRKGPAVLGINWYSGMMNPDGEGLIKVSGVVEGGHSILAMGVSVKRRTVTLHNSWGPQWGVGGRCYISWDDFGRLLTEQGDCCIPIR